MRDFQKALAEDLRRFGLVLIGAGVLADVGATFRTLAISMDAILVVTAYIVLIARGADP